MVLRHREIREWIQDQRHIVWDKVGYHPWTTANEYLFETVKTAVRTLVGTPLQRMIREKYSMNGDMVE